MFNILHKQCICFVWFSQQTAVIYLYRINWQLFVTDTENVYYAVRTNYVSIGLIKVNLSF